MYVRTLVALSPILSMSSLTLLPIVLPADALIDYRVFLRVLPAHDVLLLSQTPGEGVYARRYRD